MILAQWTYTKNEWKAFLRSSAGKNNIFKRIVHFLLSRMLKTAPIVKITPEVLWIGGDQRHFNNTTHRLKQISIREANAVNMMEITYESHNNGRVSSNEIQIPIPKGSLKEAIEVEEKLNKIRDANQQG